MRLLICGLAATAMLAVTPAEAGRNKCKRKHHRDNDCCYSTPVYSGHSNSCCGSGHYSTTAVYGSTSYGASSDCGCGSTVTPVSYAAPASDCGCSATTSYAAPASDCGCAATTSGCGATTYAASASDCGCSATSGGYAQGGYTQGVSTPATINGERVVPGSMRVISNGEQSTDSYNPARSNEVEDAPAPPAENNGGEQNANGNDRPKA